MTNELKTYSAHIFELGCMNQQVYLKSEADKVIAEKDAEIVKLKQVQEAANCQLKRALYKACANWALSTLAWLDCIDQGEPRKWSEMRRKCLAKVAELKEAK